MPISELIYLGIGILAGFLFAMAAVNRYLVGGTFQIDTSEKPYMFRINLSNDIDSITSKTAVIFKVDTSWRPERRQYIHEIDEHDIYDDSHI